MVVESVLEELGTQVVVWLVEGGDHLAVGKMKGQRCGSWMLMIWSRVLYLHHGHGEERDTAMTTAVFTGMRVHFTHGYASIVHTTVS